MGKKHTPHESQGSTYHKIGDVGKEHAGVVAVQGGARVGAPRAKMRRQDVSKRRRLRRVQQRLKAAVADGTEQGGSGRLRGEGREQAIERAALLVVHKTAVAPAGLVEGGQRPRNGQHLGSRQLGAVVALE